MREIKHVFRVFVSRFRHLLNSKEKKIKTNNLQSKNNIKEDYATVFFSIPMLKE